eukprot:s1306_g2.t1
MFFFSNALCAPGVLGLDTECPLLKLPPGQGHHDHQITGRLLFSAFFVAAREFPVASIDANLNSNADCWLLLCVHKRKNTYDNALGKCSMTWHDVARCGLWSLAQGLPRLPSLQV